MSLQNFESARKAMVESQLQPSGIVDGRVDEAFMQTPREMFVPNALRGVSYMDDNIEIGNGRTLMAPLILGQMVQNAALGKKAKVLDVGCGTGYSTAILARLAAEIVALDRDEKLLHSARLNWENLDLQNISPVLGNHTDGYAGAAPYDAIFINGAVAKAPMNLMSQLKKGGKLYCVLVEKGQSTGRIVVYTHVEQGEPISRVLADSMAPYLTGFDPQVEFEF